MSNLTQAEHTRKINLAVAQIEAAAGWTKDMDRASSKDGWAIFTEDDGYLRILRLDDPLNALADAGVVTEDEAELLCEAISSEGIPNTPDSAAFRKSMLAKGYRTFPSDASARAFVRRQAATGDPTSIAALKVHGKRFV
jgi:hypothetical protein